MSFEDCYSIVGKTSLVGVLGVAFGFGEAPVAQHAVAGRTLFGWVLGDRDRRVVASVNFALQACGTGLLTLGSGASVLLCGCILFGLGVGNLTSLPPLIAQKEFAAGDVGRVVALITAINQAVFALAPAVLGALRDLEGSYKVAFGLAACAQIAASIIVIAYRSR